MSDATPTSRRTFDHLAALQPGLVELLDVCKNADNAGAPYFCKDEFWYKGSAGSPSPRQQMDNLVGFNCTHPDALMQTNDAWDSVLEVLWASLPPCRDCPNTTGRC